MKKTTIVYLVLVLFIVGVIATGYYVFNKPHRNLKTERPQISIAAPDLFNEYASNEDSANVKYLNKVIEITGKVIDKKDNSIIIGNEMTSVVCGFENENLEEIKTIKIGQKVAVIGLCTGFGMADVVLNKCTIPQP